MGGTHTDLVLLDKTGGDLLVEKVSSTPKNPALGVLNGLSRFIARGVAPGEIEFFAHGTTITTNALLEMRGAKVGLLITKGYRAVQEVQNQARDGNLFDYFYSKPQPIAPQSLTREIPERSDYAGTVLTPLDRDAVRRAARELKDAKVDSIAVCYLFAFMNPAHEEITRQIILEEYPGVSVSLSSEVLPRIREWARMSTTLLNAYLEPVLVRYIDHLNRGLDDAKVGTQQRFLMQSNGGVMPFTAAIGGGRTVHTLFSGPAAGAQASAYLARDEAQSGLVTLDMGGTSADIAFIEGGVPLETTESVIARRQIDVPALDMSSISAGGGSIAWIDGGGFLNVGPQSAGADPGPACYGRGGTRPTVTDADVVCGYLNPGLLPRRLADARRRRVARTRCRSTSPARSRWTCWRPPSASSASSTCAWPTRCGCSPPSAASISRPSPCCRSAAPARCMPPPSRRSSACGASWCRRGPARSPRWGCCAPTWCTTTSAPSSSRSPR